MCTKSFDIVGVESRRQAYEVEQYLTGIPGVNDVQADMIDGTLIIDYNENSLSEDMVLDEIEHAGCKPSQRLSGVMDNIRKHIGAL